MRKHVIALGICLVALLAIGASPRYLEELRIGGGYGESGTYLEADGDILTDGNVTLADESELQFGADADYKWRFNGTALQLRDPAANVLASFTDSGTTGSLNVTGVLTANSSDNVIRIGGGCNLGAPPSIGSVQPNAGKFTTLEAMGVLTLPLSTSSDAGVVYSGSYPFLHSYGTSNVFLGKNAGNFTLTGVGTNVGIGEDALKALTDGYNNSGTGYQSMSSTTSGVGNTAFGTYGLFSNTVGNYNCAFGLSVLYYNTEGIMNVGFGRAALINNTTGDGNTCIGNAAGASPNSVAANANTVGNYNTYIGYKSGASVPSASALENSIAIGKNAVVGASNAMALGGTGSDAVKVGIGTTNPDRHLEINTGSATGGIRITYDDADGSATTYSDILVDSTGLLMVDSPLAVTGRFVGATITTFTANDTTPSVVLGNIFKVPDTWTMGNSITFFDDGSAGQQIVVIGGDSDCAVVAGTHLKLASTWTASSGDTLHLVYDGTDWFEIGRSDN